MFEEDELRTMRHECPCSHAEPCMDERWACFLFDLRGRGARVQMTDVECKNIWCGCVSRCPHGSGTCLPAAVQSNCPCEIVSLEIGGGRFLLAGSTHQLTSYIAVLRRSVVSHDKVAQAQRLPADHSLTLNTVQRPEGESGRKSPPAQCHHDTTFSKMTASARPDTVSSRLL